MDIPSRRQHARFPCRLEGRARSGALPRTVKLAIVNLSASGALIVAASPLSEREFTLIIQDERRLLLVPARVVRAEGPLAGGEAYGLSLHPSPRGLLRLHALIDRLRSAQWEFRGKDGELKRDYWNL